MSYQLNQYDVKSNEMAKAVIDAIAKQAEESKERIIKVAVEMFEKEVRAAVGQVAIRVCDYYSVETRGAELVIRVQISKLS